MLPDENCSTTGSGLPSPPLVSERGQRVGGGGAVAPWGGAVAPSPSLFQILVGVLAPGHTVKKKVTEK